MSKPSTIKAELYGYSVDQLKKLRNTHEDKFARNVLTAVTMLSEGYDIHEIADFLTMTKTNIYYYIKRWNKLGLKAIEDQRGKGTPNRRMSDEMEDDLLHTVLHTKPSEFDFLGSVWTSQLLSDYLYQNYGVRFCCQTMRNILHKHNFSFKRPQKKPTKGVKSEQEAFKKMMHVTLTV